MSSAVGEPTPAGQIEQAKAADAPTDAKITHAEPA